MKHAAEHARQFKKLTKKIRAAGGARPLPPVDDPMEQLLRGIFTDYASEARSNAALTRLREAVVDINELRVTPVSEIVEIVGTDFPHCRRAGEDILRALNAIFNKLHHLDLAFLKKAARRTAESFMNSLNGVNPHAKSTVLLRCLKGRAVPADTTMCEILRREGCVEPDASAEAIHKFLAAQVPESQAASFYAQFKRYAAAHAPKKSFTPPPPAKPAAPPGPPPATQKTERRSEVKARTKAKLKKASPAKPSGRKSPKPRARSARGPQKGRTRRRHR